MIMKLAAIALGSNLGDRMDYLRQAFLFLQSLSAQPIQVSSIYETAPVNCPEGSGAFMNAAALIHWDGSDPHALLDQLLAFEQSLGRPKDRPANAPRTIDLDLLFVGAVMLSSQRLTLPHPRMTQRLFVLEPLAELCPEQVLPHTQRTIREHLILCRQQADAPVISSFL